MSNHEIKSSPVAGLGVFATRPLSRGDLVLAEAPLLACTPNKSVSRAAETEHLFAALSPAQQTVYLSLYVEPFSDNTADEPQLSHLEAIQATNGFQLECQSGDTTLAGVFATASRFNHSCAPNTDYSWNSQTGPLTVHAIRELTSGEKLTIPHRPLCVPRAERQRQLKETFGFWCKCPACDLDTPEEWEVLSLRKANARRDKELGRRVDEYTRRVQQGQKVRKKTVVGLLRDIRALVDRLKTAGLLGHELAAW